MALATCSDSLPDSRSDALCGPRRGATGSTGRLADALPGPGGGALCGPGGGATGSTGRRGSSGAGGPGLSARVSEVAEALAPLVA
ncbi:MAG: hypothetical protein ABSF84_16650, partial [Acidimicrobiales bacterium]